MFFELAEFFQELGHANYVGDFHVPTGIVSARVVAKSFDPDLLTEDHRFAGEVFAVDFMVFDPAWRFGVIGFSIVAEGETRVEEVVPDKSA